jgi:DNA-binding response OmpR family regulator
MMARNVVFVGDSEEIWGDLESQFDIAGFSSLKADPTMDAFFREACRSAALIVIGPDVQGADRLALCRGIRELTDALIVVMSDPMSEVEELRLIAAGVSDISYEPNRPRVMVAQLVARLARDEVHVDSLVLTRENLRVNSVEHLVTIDDVPLNVTRTEFELLDLLMTNPRRVFTHEELSRMIWNDMWAVDHHRLETHVSRLRKKISLAGGPSIIHSIRGVGYRLLPSADMRTSNTLTA